MTVCLFENGGSHICVIALKNHLLALKKIGGTEAEVLIQTSEAVVALRHVGQKIVSVGRNGSLVVYKIEGEGLKSIESFKIGSGAINMCAIQNEETIAFSLEDDTLHLYKGGNRIALGNHGKVSDLIFSSDNELLVTTTSGVLHIIDNMSSSHSPVRSFPIPGAIAGNT